MGKDAGCNVRSGMGLQFRLRNTLGHGELPSRLKQSLWVRWESPKTLDLAQEGKLKLRKRR